MKYKLKCQVCSHEIDNLQTWFKVGQKCPKCGKNHVEAVYEASYNQLEKAIYGPSTASGFWRYFDFLPLQNTASIVSVGEGDIAVDHWTFLEDFAKQYYGIDCKVYVYRNDINAGTRTFKDAGASLAASVLKESGIDSYVVASTGNVANAFAYYMALADVSLSAFIPNDALKMNSAGVSYYGQKVFRCAGDYAYAKKLAAAYAQKHGLLLTGGNTDPLRVEAKRTMVFEWLRKMPHFPTVYIQSLSGGTGPTAIEKGLREIAHTHFAPVSPRFLMVQASGCAPMAHAWQVAKGKDFPAGWESEYPVYQNPITKVPTLATGTPGSYPLISRLVKQSKGDMLVFDEAKLIDVVRYMAFESKVRIGPAAGVAFGGFFEALKKGNIKNGDVVLINCGEGLDRSPEFFEELIYTEELIDETSQLASFNRNSLKEALLKKIVE